MNQFRRFRPHPLHHPVRTVRAHARYFAARKPSRLAQALDDFIHNQETLDHLRENHGIWTQTEKHQFRESRNAIMKFNDLMRLILVRKNHHITFNELENHLFETYKKYHSHHDLQHVEELIHSALVGMRHEVSFARILDFTGIPYRHGNDNEDRHGGDFILNGHVAIDVKASEFNAEKERAAARSAGYNDKHIIYSSIKPEDYNDQLILPDSKAKELAVLIRPTLLSLT